MNKKITLHPLKEDGTMDLDTNLYPKTNNIVNDEGESIEVVTKEELNHLKEKVTINVGDIDEDTTFADLLEKVSLYSPFVGYDSNGDSTFLGYLTDIGEEEYRLQLSDDYGYCIYEGFLQDRIYDKFLTSIHYIDDINISNNCLSIIKNYSLTMEEVHAKYWKGAYIFYLTPSHIEVIYFISFTGTQTDTEYQINIWNNKGSITKYVSKNSTLKNVLDSITLIPYETTDNKVTSISNSSTDTQYPSAKAVWNIKGTKLYRHEVVGKDSNGDTLWTLIIHDYISTKFSNSDFIHTQYDANKRLYAGKFLSISYILGPGSVCNYVDIKFNGGSGLEINYRYNSLDHALLTFNNLSTVTDTVTEL